VVRPVVHQRVVSILGHARRENLPDHERVVTTVVLGPGTALQPREGVVEERGADLRPAVMGYAVELVDQRPSAPGEPGGRVLTALRQQRDSPGLLRLHGVMDTVAAVDPD